MLTRPLLTAVCFAVLACDSATAPAPSVASAKADAPTPAPAPAPKVAPTPATPVADPTPTPTPAVAPPPAPEPAAPPTDAAPPATPTPAATIRADVAAFSAEFDPVPKVAAEEARSKEMCKRYKTLRKLASAIDNQVSPKGIAEDEAWQAAVSDLRGQFEEIQPVCDDNGEDADVESFVKDTKKALDLLVASHGA